jgi:hypothetical protein
MFTARAVAQPELMPGDRLVQCALNAAVEFDSAIRQPFTILKLSTG